MGWGIVDTVNQHPRLLGAGVIRIDPDEALHLRLKFIADSLKQVFDLYRPQAVAVEGVFTNKNARSALVLGHARGVALLVAAQSNAEVFEYAPARVKRALGAGGNDSKDAVARMVTTWLQLKAPLERADAYDAVAVALCHLNASRIGHTALGVRTGQKKPLSERLRPSFVSPAKMP